MTIIGLGMTGSKLALMLDKNSIIFSTAIQDSNNFKNANIIEISKEGASKRFTNGVKIWEKSFPIVKESLRNINNDKVIIFTSVSGGSGSSGVSYVSDILLQQNNKVLIIAILPYKLENNPPLANAVQSINSILHLIPSVTVMFFDNEIMIKKFNKDWNLINNFIVKRVDYMINLLNKYNLDAYSPITLDQSELESVIFGGGFIDFSESFLEEKLPKFEYGKLDKTTKNCLIAMLVDVEIEKENMENYHKILTEVISKVSKKAPNSRIIPGILRAKINRSNSEENINDRAYFVISSGLSIDRYINKIEKMKENAIKKATAFNEKTKKVSLKNKDMKILDI